MNEADFVVSVIRDPRVWEWIRVDDVSQDLVRYEDCSTYFTNEYGFMMFRMLNPILFEVHICMKKGAKDVDSFVRESMGKMREKGAKKFLGPIGEWNVPALKLAKRCGFVEEGRIPKAYQRDGEYQSMVFMGSE